MIHKRDAQVNTLLVESFVDYRPRRGGCLRVSCVASTLFLSSSSILKICPNSILLVWMLRRIRADEDYPTMQCIKGNGGASGNSWGKNSVELL